MESDYPSTCFLLLLLCSVAALTLADKDGEGEPRMISTTSNLPVTEGSSVLLPCNVVNIGDSDVRVWRKLPNRVLFSGTISVSSDSKISLVDKSSLHIENVTHEYSGEYLCNFFKHPHLKVLHKLLVKVPPAIIQDPAHGKVIERRGSSTKLICNATGVPKPSITWTYEVDGHQVTHLPSGVRLVHESQLHVASVDSHHSGLYRCTAENGEASPAFATFNLTVLYIPEVVVKPDWIHADEGATVEIACTCQSAPLSQVIWLKGVPKQGRHLETDDRIKVRDRITPPTMTETRLKISRMTRDDLGSYTCLAKNTVGQTWKIVEISGLAEPVQLRGDVSGDDSVLLIWTAKSYSSIIEYQIKIRKIKSGDEWTDVIIPVEDSQQTLFYSQSYNVTGLQVGQRYEAVIQAHNDFGWNRPSDTLFFAAGSPLELSTELTINEHMMITTLPLYDIDLEVTDPSYLSTDSASTITIRMCVLVVIGLIIVL